IEGVLKEGVLAGTMEPISSSLSDHLHLDAADYSLVGRSGVGGNTQLLDRVEVRRECQVPAKTVSVMQGNAVQVEGGLAFIATAGQGRRSKSREVVAAIAAAIILCFGLHPGDGRREPYQAPTDCRKRPNLFSVQHLGDPRFGRFDLRHFGADLQG